MYFNTIHKLSVLQRKDKLSVLQQNKRLSTDIWVKSIKKQQQDQKLTQPNQNAWYNGYSAQSEWRIHVPNVDRVLKNES